MSWSEIKKRKEEEEKKNKSAKTSNSGISKVANTLTGNLWKNVGQNIITSQKRAEERKQKEQEFKKSLNINKYNTMQTVAPINNKANTYKRIAQPSIINSNNSTWDKIKNVASNNSIAYVNPSATKNAVELTSADINAMEEANEFNKTMKKGTKSEQVQAVIKHFGDSILGGAKQTVGGVANVGTTLGASGVKLASLFTRGDTREKLDKVYEDIVEKGKEINDQATQFNKVNSRINNGLVRTLSGATNTASNVATNAFLTAGTGGGTILQGLQVGGSSAQEVLNENPNNIGQALATGTLKGATSYLTEKMFDANILTKGTNKSSIQKLVNNTIEKKINSQIGRTVADKAVGILGENVEEFVEDNVGNLIDKVVNNKDFPTLKEWLNNTSETVKATTLSTALLNIVGLGGSNNQDIETELKQQNASKEDIEKAKQFVEIATQQEVGDKVVDQQNKTSQNGTSQVLDTTETLRQEARNKLESIKQNYDENSYNQMQEFIETAPSEKALNQVIEDLNKETKQVAPLKQKQEVQLPMKQQTENKSFEDIAFESMNNYEDTTPQSPIQDRNINTIGKETNKNAYQYENPEVKPYFQEMAQQMGEDLAYVSSSDNRSTKKGGGTQLSTTTKAIDILHNEQGYSYEQIAKGLQNIIDDNGKENNAVSKKLELLIDEQLREGYTNALGKYVEPNQEYINNITNKTETNTVKSKSNNEVINEVQNFIKNNDLDMTADEFIEWASSKELENESNMTEQQKELYSLINDIQNRTNEEKGTKYHNIVNENGNFIDKTDGKVYNVDYDVIPYVTADEEKLKFIPYSQSEDFYKLSVDEMDKAVALCSEDANRLYLEGKTKGSSIGENYIYDYDITGEDTFGINKVEPIEANVKEVTNNNYVGRISEETKTTRNEQKRNNNDNQSISKSNRRTMQENARVDREQSRQGLLGNERNGETNSESIKNSKKSSFSNMEDTSNNTAENEIQRKINRSMTMEKAKDMVQRAFITGNIYDWFDGEYKNGDEWLAGQGADEVALIIDNDYNLQSKFVNNNEDILNEEYTIEDVIEAYQNGTLTGSSDNQTQRLDTSKDTGFKDERFYAPKDITGGKELYDLANQRVTNKNRAEIYKARADFIINAHNEGYIESLGLSQKEVNDALRKWSAYPLKARNMSGYINQGVAKENRWTGIENCSIVNELSVSEEQLNSMVKEIKGTSDDYQRRYISNTMLALDTHLNYKNLTFDFAPDSTTMRDSVLGDYQPDYDTIRIKRDGQNTVSHEMGHYIDHLIGRELADGYNLGITRLCRSNLDNFGNGKTFTQEQKQFAKNFNNFLEDIENSSDIGSSYKMSSDEVFARFVARFTEWTRNTATGNRYGYEAKWYDDHFTQPQYVEFAKLLQEYSLLKTTEQASGRSTTLASQRTGKVQEQKIEDIYSELSSKKKNTEKQEVTAPMKQQDTTPYRTSEKIAQDQSISDLEAIREESEKVNTPELETAIEKQNELQKNFNAEKSPTIDFIKKKRSKEKVGFKKIKDTLAQKIVNKGHYVDKLANETGNKKLTWLYDRALNSFAEASVSIGDHQVDSNGKEIGKSIIDIFAPAEQANLSAEFEDYLLNKHNISRYAHEKGIFGKEISSEDSQKIVDNYEAQHPEFKEWSKEVSKYNDNNLKDLVNNGLVSQETYNKLREMYGDYVPTYRDITDNLSQYLDDDSVGGNTLRRATESNRDILSVQESMAEQTLAIKKAIRMNNLGVELFKTLNPSKSDIVLDGINYDGNAILTLGGEIISKAKDGNNTFTIFQDGDMTTFKISDELYSAFEKDTLQNRINNNEVARAIMTPIAKLTQAQRNLLTTYNIGFAMSNPFKDYFDALFNTKYNSAKFIKNYTKALYNIATNGDWYQTYKNNGATGNTYFDYEKGILPTKTKNPVKKFINGIKSANEVIETAPRLAEFITTLEEGGSIDEALYNSAEITVNFKRGGDITKAVNKYGANFLNASIQGLDKAYRNLTGQNGWKGYTSLMTKSMLFQIAPALLNGILLGDDDDYEDLPEYTKDNYFLFKMGNGKFFRIPKGRVQSVMGGIARRALETAKGKDVDWNSLVETTVNQMAPNNPLEDNILAPLIQAGTGKTWYGGDIESSRLQKLPVAERSDEKTDKLSKFLGEKLNISPKKINYVLDQYSGGIGDVVLPMLTPEAENNIIEDKLTTDSVLKNKNVSKFYSTLEEAEKNKNSSKATDEDLLKYKYLSSASSEAGKLYSQKREVQNTNLSDKEKREQVREIQKQINNIVEKALSDVDKMSIKGGSAKIGDQEYYKDNGSWKKLTEKEKTKLKDTSLDTYSSYKESLKNYESKKGENLTDKDKIQVLRDSNYSKKEKSALYSKTMSNDTYYPTLEKSGIDIDEYMDYKLAYSNGKFIADKDKNGKTIIGSGKNKVINYLNKNITGAGNRLLIAGKYYSLQNSEKQKLAEYVNKIASTKEEKIDIYKQLTKNFTVQNGNIYMKVSK